MIRTYFLIILFTFSATGTGWAQALLNKPVSIEVTKKPLKQVLKTIAAEGGFHFSYNSSILNEDSLVSLHLKDIPVRQVLDMIFDEGISYKEKDNYIILQRSQGYWYVSGYVRDELTGESIPNASVYEKNQLVASLTNEQGFFQLRLKDRLEPATISVSKAWYADTSLPIKPGNSEEITVSIAPRYFGLDSVVISPHGSVEDTWLGKFFLSSQQKMQSLNISKFFVDLPYQASVIPGIGTHGKMGAQVTNKVSFNVFGGYAAGVNGVEIGGLFNIVKKEVRYSQIAGLFNIAGGKVEGVQIAGLYNHALDSLAGAQIAGLSNMLLGNVEGTQISGLYNHVQGQMNGAQITGLSNFTRQQMDGTQIAGLTNIAGERFDGAQIAGFMNIGGSEGDGVQIGGVGNVAKDAMAGLQIAGIFNFTRRLEGVQIGLVNIADTSSGFSIGVLNLVRKGHHKLAVSIDELSPVNLAFKAGNKRLYSILTGSWDPDAQNQVVRFGYGMGTELTITKWCSINPELTSEYVYLGAWNSNSLNKLHLDFTFHINRYISIYGGPSITAYYEDSHIAAEGFRSVLPPAGYTTYDLGYNITSWFGWQAGLNFF